MKLASGGKLASACGNFLGLELLNSSEPTPVEDMDPQLITDCGNIPM